MHLSATSFRHLKRQVPIGRILSFYGFDSKLKRRGDQLFGPCPLHGGDNPTAFVTVRAPGEALAVLDR
jgi:hypothetical protein